MGSRSARFVLGLALGLALTVWLARASPADQLSTFSTAFLGIFIEATPFLLLGAIASGLVEVFVSAGELRRRLPSGRLGGLLAGAALGFFLPVGECGTVPVARRLIHKGLPASVAVAFLLAAPVVNPIALASTAAAFGYGAVLVWRFVLAVVVAGIVGVIFSIDPWPQRLLRPGALPALQGGSQAAAAALTQLSRGQNLNRALLVAGDEFIELGGYLVLGSALAGALQTLIPQEQLLELGSGPLSSVLVMLGAAVLLSVCSTSDSFAALAFVGTFGKGSVLAFLVYGTMVDVKNVVLYRQLFRPRGLVYLVLIPFGLTMTLGVLANLVLSR